MRLPRSASIAAIFCASTLARGARADEQASLRTLTVQRDPGTETCPDADSLSSEVAALRGRGKAPVLPFHVRFARSAAGLSARIEGQSGTRLLSASGPACDGLARATALTLTLLVDAELSREEREPAPPAHPAASVAAAPAKRPTAPARREPLRASVGLGTLLLVGEIADVTPALAADAGLRFGRLRTSLGALLSLPQRFELGPGEVSVELLLLDARLCVAAARLSARLELELCSGAWVGVANARAKGYDTNHARHQPWLGLPFELAIEASASQRIYFDASGGLLLPLTRREFAVDGLGPVYETPAVAGFAALRVGFLL